MILVDNGYLVALVETRDELHERAVRWAKIVNEPLFVSEYVLWEVVNALSHPFDRQKPISGLIGFTRGLASSILPQPAS